MFLPTDGICPDNTTPSIASSIIEPTSITVTRPTQPFAIRWSGRAGSRRAMVVRW
jgi:hypothetical protein